MTPMDALEALEKCGELNRLVARASAHALRDSVDTRVNTATRESHTGGVQRGAAGRGVLFTTIQPVMTPAFYDQLLGTSGITVEQLDALLDECETAFRMRGERRGMVGLRRWVVAFVGNRAGKLREMRPAGRGARVSGFAPSDELDEDTMRAEVARKREEGRVEAQAIAMRLARMGKGAR